MARTDQLHKGMVIRHQGELFSILDYKVAQTGKQKPTVHVKLRSLKSGHTGDRTLDELGKIEEVPAETRQMQYLYASGHEHVFMDTSPVEHAGGSTNVYKEAKLASGFVVQVPLFIKNGDKIRVSTETHEYLGKAH